MRTTRLIHAPDAPWYVCPVCGAAWWHQLDAVACEVGHDVRRDDVEPDRTTRDE